MLTAAEIARTFDASFPFEDACSYDNVGLLVGRSGREVKKALIALDVTTEVIKEAKDLGVDLIVSHHPVIFREVKRITDESYTGLLLLSLIESGLAAIALHTNFDKGIDGNNDCLAKTLGATSFERIEEGFATVFDLPEEEDFDLFVKRVKTALSDAALRTIGGGKVKRVIASCGAGIDEDLIFLAKKEGAVIVTADVKHNYAVMAKDLSVRLVEATHYASEWGFTKRIKEFMAERFPGVELFVSKKNINPYDPS